MIGQDANFGISEDYREIDYKTVKPEQGEVLNLVKPGKKYDNDEDDDDNHLQLYSDHNLVYFLLTPTRTTFPLELHFLLRPELFHLSEWACLRFSIQGAPSLLVDWLPRFFLLVIIILRNKFPSKASSSLIPSVRRSLF